MKSLVKEINAAIALTLLVVALLFVAIFFPYQKREKDRFLKERLFFLQTFVKSEERTLVDPIFENNPGVLRQHLSRLAKTEGIESIAVFDAAGQLLADHPEDPQGHNLGPEQREEVVKKEGGSFQIASWNGEQAMIYRAPFQVVQETIGYIQVVYSLRDVARIQKASLLFFFLFLTTLVGTSTFLLNLMMSNLVTRPIRRLVKATEAVEGGKLDVRAKRARNDEIGQLNESFNKMIARLQGSFEEIEKQNIELKELDRLKDEFLANVSHEIRTPLHAIIGFSEGMLEEIRESEQKKYLQTILDNGRSLSALVERLLDFSEIRAQQMGLGREFFPIQRVTDNVLLMAQRLIGEKPIHLVDQIPKELSPVYADPLRVQQIFLNLLENAVKFTEGGEITLMAGERPEAIQFAVKDTGIGIPQETMKYIFEEFRQGDGSTKRKYGGTGLGLSIVKKLVRLHGGEIWVESIEGKGSTFSFTLPKA
ncbi:MAG: HAMP domain-containing protein [Deltaproteobacteria bacterium]|nr:HAMP domain-containing protein [Deltaproteobacteria bacterium]